MVAKPDQLDSKYVTRVAYESICRLYWKITSIYFSVVFVRLGRY